MMITEKMENEDTLICLCKVYIILIIHASQLYNFNVHKFRQNKRKYFISLILKDRYFCE